MIYFIGARRRSATAIFGRLASVRYPVFRSNKAAGLGSGLTVEVKGFCPVVVLALPQKKKQKKKHTHTHTPLGPPLIEKGPADCFWYHRAALALRIGSKVGKSTSWTWFWQSCVHFFFLSPLLFFFSFLSSSSCWCQLSYFDLPSSLKSKACLTELPTGATVCELGKTVSSCRRGIEGVWCVFHPRNHQLRDACLLCLSLESQWCCWMHKIQRHFCFNASDKILLWFCSQAPKIIVYIVILFPSSQDHSLYCNSVPKLPRS